MAGPGPSLGCQTGQAIGSAFQGIVAEVARGAAELVVTTSTWWVETDSIDPRDPAVAAAQDATRELILIILMGSVLVQSIRIIVSRKGEPLVVARECDAVATVSDPTITSTTPTRHAR